MLEPRPVRGRRDAAIAARAGPAEWRRGRRPGRSAGAVDPPPGLLNPPRSAAARVPSAGIAAAGAEGVRVGVASTVGRVGHRHRTAGARRDVERELPLVVSRRAAVRSDGRFLALAANARSCRRATWHGRLHGWTACCCCPRPASVARLGLSRLSGVRLTGAGTRVDAWLLRAELQRHELAVLGHRVLVFLAQEPVLRPESRCSEASAFGMLAFLNLKRAIARAYCSPRKTSSASFSRCAS